MTSLEFFPPTPRNTGAYPEWGTGQMKEVSKASLWTPKGATWQYTGEPIEQYYDLTSLKKSNLRLNDQLLPSPQQSEMHKLMSSAPFPAEHPYSSHQSKFAVFPKFDCPDDPKRGVKARGNNPKNEEMPAQPYDVVVISKTKGSGLRHELQRQLPNSEHKPLVWHEHDFHQVPKSSSSDRQTYYPIPPKQYVPNLVERQAGECIKGDMVVTPRTANTTRNIERAQWKTTYELNHTGLGPSNPLALDNYDEKMVKKAEGIDDDKLYPREVPTFDPPRPMEGRIARGTTPLPDKQTDRFQGGQYDPSYQRPMSLTEREERRLLEGGDYINLPEGTNPYEEEKLRLQREMEHRQQHGQWQEDEVVPFGPSGTVEPFRDLEQEKLAVQHHDSLQQMEASNRWRVLESQKPHHDLLALQQKMDDVSVKTQPRVFYTHEGRYQRERAGLYKTSYDPYKLQYSMNKDEQRGAAIMDHSNSHVDALNVPTSLNGEMADVMRYNRTLGGPPGSVAQFHDQPSQYEAMGPFNMVKKLQKDYLQPNMQTSDVRTQEGGTLQKESLYGSSYNTKKFLQENQMPFHGRNEPLDLMSNENQNLNRVRLTAIPRSDKVTGRHLGEARPHTAPEPGAFNERYSYQSTAPRLTVSTSGPKHRNRRGNSDQFVSKSTNFVGAGDWSSKSAFQSQFPGSASLDLSYKGDERFNWNPEWGTPRPQSSLLEIQRTFSKTEARKRFHECFPETGIDLRENITRGRGHTFGGINAQILRGAAIDVS